MCETSMMPFRVAMPASATLRNNRHSARRSSEMSRPTRMVAPPAALGILRKALDRQVADHVIAEVGKDLTNQPVPDIEKALSG